MPGLIFLFFISLFHLLFTPLEGQVFYEVLYHEISILSSDMVVLAKNLRFTIPGLIAR